MISAKIVNNVFNANNKNIKLNGKIVNDTICIKYNAMVEKEISVINMQSLPFKEIFRDLSFDESLKIIDDYNILLQININNVLVTIARPKNLGLGGSYKIQDLTLFYNCEIPA